MGSKNVIYNSQTRLPCVGCNPADVILCVPASFVAHPDTDYNPRFIAGTLLAGVLQKNSCSQNFYQYTVSYDDTQLIAGANLTGQDILGIFCKGCIATWVDDRFALLSETVNDEVTTLEASITAITRKYFPSGRVGPTPLTLTLTGLAIPTTLTTLANPVNSSFTNTDDKPVWVTYYYETPLLVFTLATNMGYSYDYDYSITNDAVVVATGSSIPIGGRTNAGPNGDYIAIPNGLTGLPIGSFKVLPGKTISMSTTMRINPSNVVADAGNQVSIRGPWINYNVIPADV